MADPVSKPKTLKDLQKEIPSRDELFSRIAAMQLVSDYQAAVLSAAILEYILQQTIITKFIALGNDQLDAVFSVNANSPLSTLSAKIKIAYALGIIGPETRSHIDRIRTIRNHFAHHKDISSFSDSVVAAECAKFKETKMLDAASEEVKKARQASMTPKLRYVQTALFICVALSNYVISRPDVPPSDTVEIF